MKRTSTPTPAEATPVATAPIAHAAAWAFRVASSHRWRHPAVALLGLFCGVVHAQGLPWEGPLTTLQQSLTGPVARAIGVIALAASGGMLAFGGELGEFTKRIMMLVLALSVMLLANNFMALFGG